MRKILTATKALFLLSGLLILGWAATSTPSTASAATWCAQPGKDCEITQGGTTYHMKEFQAY